MEKLKKFSGVIFNLAMEALATIGAFFILRLVLQCPEVISAISSITFGMGMAEIYHLLRGK